MNHLKPTIGEFLANIFGTFLILFLMFIVLIFTVILENYDLLKELLKATRYDIINLWRTK